MSSSSPETLLSDIKIWSYNCNRDNTISLGANSEVFSYFSFESYDNSENIFWRTLPISLSVTPRTPLFWGGVSLFCMRYGRCILDSTGRGSLSTWKKKMKRSLIYNITGSDLQCFCTYLSATCLYLLISTLYKSTHAHRYASFYVSVSDAYLFTSINYPYI